MIPLQARQPQNYGKVYFNLYGDLESPAGVRDVGFHPTTPGFQGRSPLEIYDRVRISKNKRETFDKGYTPNWTEEVFIVDEIKWTNLITYKIRDLNGDPIKGTFYREELQKTDQNIYRIESHS